MSKYEDLLDSVGEKPYRIDYIFWNIYGWQDDLKFPLKQRSLAERLFGMKKEFRNPGERNNDYIFRLIKQGKTFSRYGRVYVVKNDLSLEFEREEQRVVLCGNQVQTSLVDVNLHYMGWILSMGKAKDLIGEGKKMPDPRGVSFRRRDPGAFGYIDDCISRIE
jgi:hypothetical protein